MAAMTKEDHLIQWIAILDVAVILWVLTGIGCPPHDKVTIMNYPSVIGIRGEP